LACNFDKGFVKCQIYFEYIIFIDEHVTFIKFIVNIIVTFTFNEIIGGAVLEIAFHCMS